LRLLLLLIVTATTPVKFSFCPAPPRMVQHFSYEKPWKDAIPELRTFLEMEGFQILEYAPEDGFMFTDYKVFDWGRGKRLLALAVHIHDKVTITGMGKMDIPVSSLGNNDEIMKTKTLEKLPYRIQKRIFLPLRDKLDSLGYKILNHKQ